MNKLLPMLLAVMMLLSTASVAQVEKEVTLVFWVRFDDLSEEIANYEAVHPGGENQPGAGGCQR